MGVLTPIQEGQRGFKAFLRGLHWLKRNPRYLFLLSLPTVIGLLSLTSGLGFIWSYEDTIMAAILFDKPDSVFLITVYYMCKAFLYISFLILSFVLMILVINVISSPIYEMVSVAVEKDFIGGPVEEPSFWDSLKLMGAELKKVSFIFFVSLILFLIPGVNLLATLVTAFLVGWDFYDYPTARRGWGFSRRLRFVSKDMLSVTAFGLWLMIPFVQFFMMPLAVAGGTLLSLESLKRNNLLQNSSV